MKTDLSSPVATGAFFKFAGILSAAFYIHGGILLSLKKEYIWVSSDEVDETRTYYTEWNESERER